MKTTYTIKPVEGADADDRETIVIVVCELHVQEMPQVDGDLVTSAPADDEAPCEYCRFQRILARVLGLN